MGRACNTSLAVAAVTRRDSVSGRTRGASLPLLAVYPEIASQLMHPARTTPAHLTVDLVTAGSNYYFTWRCEHGHEWEARVNDRTHGNGCPQCPRRIPVPRPGTALADTHPALAEQMVGPARTTPAHLTADLVTAGSNYYFVWRCERGHEWEAGVFHRTGGSGCSQCHRDAVRARQERPLVCLGCGKDAVDCDCAGGGDFR